MSNAVTEMKLADWALLVLLSVLWGGSFYFVALALAEWPPLVIVAVRIVVACIALLVFLKVTGIPLPREAAVWRAFLVMGILNNVVPFLLIVWGQQSVASGLASVLNAATPIFSLLLGAWLLHDEQLTLHRVAGAGTGLIGVTILVGPSVYGGGNSLAGQLAILGAAFSYAMAGIYARRFAAMGVRPIVAATGQLVMSSIIVSSLVLFFDEPATLLAASAFTWLTVGAMAIVSRAFAYIIYFRLIESAGATNALLVTLLIPVTAILLGTFSLGERLTLAEVAGIGVIAAGLVLIDGRVLRWRRRSSESLSVSTTDGVKTDQGATGKKGQ